MLKEGGREGRRKKRWIWRKEGRKEGGRGSVNLEEILVELRVQHGNF